MRNTVLSVALLWLLVGCAQKPVPWVKENAQKAYDLLGFEKDRGSALHVPSYYQGNNRARSEQAGEVLYLNTLYPQEAP